MTKRRGWHEGTIYRRANGSWRAQISMAGKTISHSAPTRAECVTWLQRINRDGNAAAEEVGQTTTLERFLCEWLESVKGRLKPKTIFQYHQVIHIHILPYLGNYHLSELRLEMIDKYYGQLLKRGVGARTIQIVHSTLHVALERAARYGEIPRNPVQGALVPKATHVEMSVLDEEQVSRFLAAAHGTVYHGLFHMAVVTGMRQAELLGLKWADISWNRGTISVRRQAQRVPRQGIVMAEPKTRAGRRTIKLGENTLQMLREQQARQQLTKALAGSRWVENDLIFPSAIGTPIDLRNVHREFKAVLRLSGLSDIRFHDLRHTAASLMLNHGIPVIVVSKILGHSKPSVTVDIYGHLYNEMQDGAAAVMDELVTPVPIQLPNRQDAEMLKISAK